MVSPNHAFGGPCEKDHRIMRSILGCCEGNETKLLQ